MDKEKTGRLIKEMRNKHNFTQNQLAERLGVTNKAVSRWETGKSFPDIAILDVLANVLEISIEEVVTGELQEKEDSSRIVHEIVQEAKEQNRKKYFKIVTAFLVVGCIFLLFLILFFAMALQVINGAIDVNNAELNIGLVMLIALSILCRFGLPCVGLAVTLTYLYEKRNKKTRWKWFIYVVLGISIVWLSRSICIVLFL